MRDVVIPIIVIAIMCVFPMLGAVHSYHSERGGSQEEEYNTEE